MKAIFGTILVVFAFFASIYFKKYHGQMIPYPWLWYLVSIVIGLLGLTLIISSISKRITFAKRLIADKVQKHKSNSYQFEINYDNCEFKSGSYSVEARDERISGLNLFAPSIFGEQTTMESVVSSYFIYSLDEVSEKMTCVSQSFPVDKDTLQFYVLTKKIKLYIDRENPQVYLFELQN